MTASTNQEVRMATQALAKPRSPAPLSVRLEVARQMAQMELAADMTKLALRCSTVVTVQAAEQYSRDIQWASRRVGMRQLGLSQAQFLELATQYGERLLRIINAHDAALVWQIRQVVEGPETWEVRRRQVVKLLNG